MNGKKAAAVDLNSLLKNYAIKNQTAFIEKEPFVENLIVQASYMAKKYHAWAAWTVRPREKFKFDLEALVKRDTVAVVRKCGVDYIYVPAYYSECVRKAWVSKVTPELFDMAFPSIDSLPENTPAKLIKVVEFEKDFFNLLNEPQTGDLPIIQLTFQDKCSDIVILSSIIETRLVDDVAYKIRGFLKEANHRKLYWAKLNANFANSANYVDTLYFSVLDDQDEFVRAVKSGNKKTVVTLDVLCTFILASFNTSSYSNDIDIGIMQSAHLLKLLLVYYRDAMSVKDNVEIVEKVIDEKLVKPPFVFTFSDIRNFTNANGAKIGELLSVKDISAIIQKRTQVFPSSKMLPDLLVFYEENNANFFVLKSKLYYAFNKMLEETSPSINKTILSRWETMIKEFREEDAMKNDSDFETLVVNLTSEKNKLLVNIYFNNKFHLAKEELGEYAKEDKLFAETFFNDGIIISLQKMMGLERQRLLSGAKRRLPIWYSFPLVVVLVKFFRKYFYEP